MLISQFLWSHENYLKAPLNGHQNSQWTEVPNLQGIGQSIIYSAGFIVMVKRRVWGM